MKTLKTFVLWVVLLSTMLALASCTGGYRHRTFFGMYFTSSSSSGTGGLMRLNYFNGTVEPIISSEEIVVARQTGMMYAPMKRINLPSSAGHLILRYDPPCPAGTFRVTDCWYVDGVLRKQEDRNYYGFSYGFEGGGDHIIQLITLYATAGDYRTAGADTLRVFVHSYRDAL